MSRSHAQLITRSVPGRFVKAILTDQDSDGEGLSTDEDQHDDHEHKFIDTDQHTGNATTSTGRSS